MGRAGGPIGRSLVRIPCSPRSGLSYMPKYPWARFWTPELLLMCSWHPMGQPLPSVRVLQWAGDSFRVYPGLCPWVELDLAPVSPATPQGDKKRQHPATLTEKRKRKRTLWTHYDIWWFFSTNTIEIVVTVKSDAPWLPYTFICNIKMLFSYISTHQC